MEKEHWITRDNLDTKITTDLFKTPATTGLLNRYSEFWRYSAYTTDIDRMLKKEESQEKGDYYANEIILAGDAEMGKRIEMIDFLDQSVSSGAERANFKNLVDEFLAEIEDIDEENYLRFGNGGVSEITDVYNEVCD